MDAKPQRPHRLHRAPDMDENASAVGPKLLHQRFKSTSALEASVPGSTGFNGAIKRTAFAEISNLPRKVVQDDSNIGTKSPALLAEKRAAAQRNEKGSTAALLRPAQRGPYLAPIITQETINDLVQNEGIDPAVAAVAAAVTAPLTYRVFNNRRSTVFKPETLVYKDNGNEGPKQAAPTGDDTAQRRTSKPAEVPEDANSAAVKAANEARRSIAILALQKTKAQEAKPNAAKKTGDDAAQQPISKIAEVPEPANSDAVKAANEARRSLAILALEKAKAKDSTSQAAKETGVDVAQEDDVIDVKGDPHVHQPSIPPPQLSELYGPSGDDDDEEEEHAADEALAMQPATAASFEHAIEGAYKETENQSGDDDEYLYVEDDGYTTARSFRSRGDNTTGGAPTVVFPPRTMSKDRIELIAAKNLVETSMTVEQVEDDVFDPSMVAEYTEEIFEYMAELEIKMLPNAHYMDNQTEIQWSMRSVLIDWVIQVHARFHLLPETLFLSVNFVDRFLSCKIVSLGKLQLVGATALLIAAKYEEINAPSIPEMVYMVDSGYTIDEIQKAERFMLSMLQFELGWPGPMSFLRRVSKADDYDLDTRTLAKYFLEASVIDERFVGCPPSFMAAGAHCLARYMLKKGDWSPAHMYYSGYTFSQLRQLMVVLLDMLDDARVHHTAVFEKYMDRRYKRAALFAAAELNKRSFRLPTLAELEPNGYHPILGCSPDLYGEWY